MNWVDRLELMTAGVTGGAAVVLGGWLGLRHYWDRAGERARRRMRLEASRRVLRNMRAEAECGYPTVRLPRISALPNGVRLAGHRR